VREENPSKAAFYIQAGLTIYLFIQGEDKLMNL